MLRGLFGCPMRVVDNGSEGGLVSAIGVLLLNALPLSACEFPFSSVRQQNFQVSIKRKGMNGLSQWL